MVWIALLLVALLAVGVGWLATKLRAATSVIAELRQSISTLTKAQTAERQQTDNQVLELKRIIKVFREQGDEVRGRTTNLKSGTDEVRERTTTLKQVADERNEGQQRLNAVFRDDVQDLKDRGAAENTRVRSLSGELIHGSSRFVSNDERTILLKELVPTLGLDWVTERHLLYLEHAVPPLEARLRGRLAAPTAAMVLRSLVVMAAPDPTRLLEIGTLYGVSAAYLHEVVRHRKTEFHQTIIDPFFGYYGEDNPDLFTPIPVIADVFVDNMRRVGATSDDFRVEVGLAEDDDIRARLANEQYEVLVIDGDHSYEGVKRDFENYAGHVVPGGYIIIDDYQGPSWPEVTEYVDEVVFTDSRFEVISGDLRTAVVRRRV